MNEYYFTLDDESMNLHLKQYVYAPGRYMFNWHRDIELMLVLKGQVEVCVEGRTYLLCQNDLLLINSNCGHASLQKETGSISMVIHVDPDFLSDTYENVEQLRFHVASTEDQNKQEVFSVLRRMMAGICRAFQSGDKASGLEVKGILLQLFAELIREFTVEMCSDTELQHTRKSDYALKKMTSIIEANYDRKITLDELARQTNYNRTYVSTLFKNGLGINFYDYLTRTRLQEALFELDNPDRKLADIALDAGFSDIKSFNSYFKKQFNKTPTEYREEIKLTPRPLYTVRRQAIFPYPNEEIDNILKSYRQPVRTLYVPSAISQDRDEWNQKKLRLEQICEELKTIINE